MTTVDCFPLHGVIGVVANAANEIDEAVAKGLSCVEIRADLLLDAGLSLDEVMAMVHHARQQDLACLFTLRHPTHGGAFRGTEKDRVGINRQALDRGADIIDLEWQSSAAADMLADGAPTILSHHDFDRMPSNDELTALTQNMIEANPRAIKMVPTATTLADAARMLNWVKDGVGQPVRRIGFAMGEAGRCSRVLTLACGAPITYATLGDAVAPGQIAIDELLACYRANELRHDTELVAVTGDNAVAEREAQRLNQEYQRNRSNRVAIAFGELSIEQVNSLASAIDVVNVSV